MGGAELANLTQLTLSRSSGTMIYCLLVSRFWASNRPAGLADTRNFLFHDLRYTFAWWHMIHGGGHSNIRMTERYAKLGKGAKSGDKACGM